MPNLLLPILSMTALGMGEAPPRYLLRDEPGKRTKLEQKKHEKRVAKRKAQKAARKKNRGRK